MPIPPGCSPYTSFITLLRVGRSGAAGVDLTFDFSPQLSVPSFGSVGLEQLLEPLQAVLGNELSVPSFGSVGLELGVLAGGGRAGQAFQYPPSGRSVWIRG